MKTKYVFPAVFEPETDGGYSIYVPDVPGCYTQSDTIEDGLQRIQDALCLMLYDMEERGDAIPEPSRIQEIESEAKPSGFATLIQCDTLEYRRYFSDQPVEKTLSIPGWLNELGEKEGLNFSVVLQSALKQTLGIESIQ